MKSRIIAASLALAFAAPALAADWVPIAESRSAVFEARNGSMEFDATVTTGTPVITMIVRVREKQQNRLYFERKYVTLDDCRAGYGTIVTVSLNGGRVEYSSQFIFDGGNNAARLAQTLCEVALRVPGTSM